MRSTGIMSVLLLLCIVGGVVAASVGSPQRHTLSSSSPFSDSTSPSVSSFTPESIFPSRPSPPHSSTTSPPIISTPPPVITPPHPGQGHPGSGSGSGSGSGGNPIGNWFKCAKQFDLVVFSVKEIYTSNSTSEIFSLENHQLIGLAAGNCPDIEGTESPTGSGLALQSCVFTYELFNRGRFVETGTFDPSPNGVSNNAVTGIDGEFFQALGLEHIRNFADGTGGIDTFYFCEVKTNSCSRDSNNNQHDNNDHDNDNNNQHDNQEHNNGHN